MTRYGLRLTALMILTVGLAGCAASAQRDASVHFNRLSVQPASAERLIVCHGFGCARRTPVRLSKSARSELRRMFASASSAERERQAIERAVIWFDKRYGPLVGTDRDIGGFDPQNAGKVGQQDCIDDATTTAGLLLLIDKNGLLRHHRVGQPVARGYFLDGRYPHATATIIEKETAIAFAIDPWPYDAGAAPDVIPLDRWFKIRRGGAREQE